jgi:uncharacterized protein (TIGR02246 family)
VKQRCDQANSIGQAHQDGIRDHFSSSFFKALIPKGTIIFGWVVQFAFDLETILSVLLKVARRHALVAAAALAAVASSHLVLRRIAASILMMGDPSMKPRLIWILSIAFLFFGSTSHPGLPVITADDSPQLTVMQAAADAYVKDFNAAKPEAVAAHFLPQGELIDDEGNVYQGQEELQKLFSQYFATFPGATLDLNIESVHEVSDGMLIEEGTRLLSTKDGATAQVRYVTVRAKTDGQWRIASTREFKDDPAPSPGDRLAALAWLVGDWVSEGDDAAVKISYRWDEDQNFLLGDIRSTRNGKPLMKSTQRIGWDPLADTVRSWMFDGDGGFAEGTWTQVDDGWVIKTQATLPEGATGSATVTITSVTKDQFILRGTERIVGDRRIDDFELTVSRAPPDVQPADARATLPAPLGKAPAVPQR